MRVSFGAMRSISFSVFFALPTFMPKYSAIAGHMLFQRNMSPLVILNGSFAATGSVDIQIQARARRLLSVTLKSALALALEPGKFKGIPSSLDNVA